MFVSQWLSQMGRISSAYSSKSGMDERVTRILSGMLMLQTCKFRKYKTF